MTEVIANPYARHDMDWSSAGSGLCVKYVTRPDGSLRSCDEPLMSPIHGDNNSKPLPFVPFPIDLLPKDK